MATFGYEATLTSKAQITIPKAVRRQLAAGPGDKLLFLVEGETIEVRKVQAAGDRDWQTVEMAALDVWTDADDGLV